MAMNNQRKAAAVKKYGPLFADPEASLDQVEAAIKEDPKNYTPEEIDEILSSIGSQEIPEPAPKEEPPAKAVAKPTLNKLYEEWTVEPIITEKKIPGGGGKTYKHQEEGDAGFEKIKKLRETTITPDRAELLNEQSNNSRKRLYVK